MPSYSLLFSCCWLINMYVCALGPDGHQISAVVNCVSVRLCY